MTNIFVKVGDAIIKAENSADRAVEKVRASWLRRSANKIDDKIDKLSKRGHEKRLELYKLRQKHM